MADIDLTGFELGQGIDVGTPSQAIEQEQVEQRSIPIPTLSEITSDERYQNMNVFKRANVLGEYRKEVANYLVDSRSVANIDEFNSEIEKVNQALAGEVDKFSSLEVGFGALAFNPFKELKESVAGLGKTGLEARRTAQSRRIQEEFRRQAVAQAQFSDEDRFTLPDRREIEDTLELPEFAQDLEDIRVRAKEELEADVERQGRAVIQEFSDTVSAVNIGSAITQLAADIGASAALETVPVVGKVLGPGYFAVTAAARSDKAQRDLEEAGVIDPRSSEERFARSATVGVVSGALERFGIGFLTNADRAQKLGKGLTQFAVSKGLSKEIAEAAGRIGGASIGEATTELGQAWVETFGNQVEGFDEFIEVISDGEQWQDAQGQALLGGIVGGLARGSIEGTSAAIRQLVASDKYQQLLKGKSEDISKQIIQAQKQIDEARVAEQEGLELEDTFSDRVPLSELKDPARAIERGITGAQRRIPKRELLSAEGARDQGEFLPIRPVIEDQIGRLLDNPDYLQQNNITDQQSFLAAIVKDGTFDRFEQQIDELTDADPNVDKEGIIFKAVNRSFNIPDVEPEVSAVDVPATPQALRAEPDAGPAVDQSFEPSTIGEPTAPPVQLEQDPNVRFSLDPNSVQDQAKIQETIDKAKSLPKETKTAIVTKKQIPFQLQENVDGAEAVTKLRDVIQIAERELDIPIRRGAKKSLDRAALAQFDQQSGVIRTRYANDLQEIAHEIGHALSDRLELIQDINTPYNRELLELGKATSSPDYTAAQILEEGRAEYFRNRVVNPDFAQQVAPQFHQEFEQRLAANPELQSSVQKIESAYSSVINQDPLQRGQAGILTQRELDERSQGTRAERLQDFARRTAAQFIDRDIPIKNMQEDIYGKREAQELEIVDDAYKLKANSAGVQGQVNFWLENGITNNAGEVISPSFKEIVDMPLPKYKDSTAYFKALRVLENVRNGIELQDISQTEAEAQISQYEKKYPDFRETTKKVRDWNNAILDIALENEVITKEEHSNMKAKGKEYFPMGRAYETTATQGTGSVANPFKYQSGDTKDTMDGFGIMQDNALTLAKAIRQQKVNKALRKMSQEKNAGRFIERVDRDTKETQVISVTHEGKRELYHIPDPLTYDALSYNNPSSEVMSGGLLGLLGDTLLTIPASIVRTTAIFNPAFIAKNLAIDTTTAAIQSRTGSIPVVNSVHGLMLKANESLIKDFMLSGADQSLLRQVELGEQSAALRKIPILKNVINKLDELREQSKEKLGVDVANPIGYANALAESFENAPRLDEFKRVYESAIDAGKSRDIALEEAAYAARNLTIDFSKGGAFTKKYNKYVPFLNAGAQGSIKVAQTLATPRGMLAFLGLVLLPEMISWAMNSDDEEYQELSDFDKDSWWYIPKVGEVEEGESNYMRIPKPRGYSFIANEIRKSWDEDEEAHSLAESLKAEGKSYMVSSLPTFIKIPLEVNFNKSFFKDRDIVNDYYDGMALENQFHDYTTETAKFVGPKLGMSPIMFDHMAQSVLTRYWTLGNATIDDAAGKNLNAPDKDFNNSMLGQLSGFGQFFGSKPQYRAKSLTELTEVVERLDGLKKDKKKMSKEAYAERAETYSSILKNERSIRSANGRIRNLARRVKDTYNAEGITPEAKRKKIDKLYEQMLDISRKALGKD